MARKRPNWLLRGLIILSFGIHAVIFTHISGLYRSDALSFIELTLQDVSNSPKRSIPRPPHRPKDPPRPKNVEQLKVAKRPIPSFKPIKMDPVEQDLPDGLMERISTPAVPAASDVSIASWNPEKIETAAEPYQTPGSYLEMVKLIIERNKKYPEAAKRSRTEGRVTLRFVITPEGDLGAAEVIKKSRSKDLDQAALNAVKGAAPFPRPPKAIFKGAVTLVLTVVFELT
jgi:protein TonB